MDLFTVEVAFDDQPFDFLIDDVSRLQNLPIQYQITLPRQELAGWCYAIALSAISLLILAKIKFMRKTS